MSSKPSLLYVATIAATVRQFLTPYAIHFRALGWRVGAVANGATVDQTLRDSFDDLYELPISRSVLDLAGIVRGRRVMTKILASSPDIVHVHTPIASFITRHAIHGMPPTARPLVVYTAHGFHFHKGGRMATNATFLAAERLAGRWTDRLVVINDEDEEAALRHRIVAAQKVARMPGIGVETAFYSPSQIQVGQIARARQTFGLGVDTPYFVSVGELSPGKRTGDIIEALSAMRDTESLLVLAGTGRERARLELLAAECGVGGRVRFAGHIDDVRALVAGAVALVHASEREGLARAIMEALALEVPVVASNARGNQELVDPGRGFIVPIRGVRLLAARMDWLIEHPTERVAMGKRGRTKMIERYDLSILLELHEVMYRRMLAEQR